MLKYRLYEAYDEPALRELFSRQEFPAPVDLPIPKRDPAVAFGMVLEEDGRLIAAIIPRVSLELHLVIDPDEPAAAKKMLELAKRTEGGVMLLSQEAKKLQLPQFTDAIAFVPRDNPRMLSLMDALGFTRDTDKFQSFWKPVGMNAPVRLEAADAAPTATEVPPPSPDVPIQ